MHMQKNNPVAGIIDTYFNNKLDFRAQIFNTLGFLGIFLGLISGAFALFILAETEVALINLGISAIAVFIVRNANATKNFRRYFIITVIAVFIIIFPILFFRAGGYHGGMPAFFVFALVFTAIMVEGRQKLCFIVLELLLYLACFMVAWFYPRAVIPFEKQMDVFLDVTLCCLIAGAFLALAINRHIVVYERKLKELDYLNRLKMEFLQDISHEMQNPLTTITRGIGFAESHMNDADKSAAAHDALKLAEDEALRLGRMVSGMVKLASVSGGTESREKINFAEMLVNCAETFRLQLDNKNNKLSLSIEPDLPFVYAAADQLKQVLINILMNTAKHTKNGRVAISAARQKDFVVVSIWDNGEGIPKELLPKVFERGVSSIGSTGYGLSISRTIVEAHGGQIGIESQYKKGTTVTFSIPVYGGQEGVRSNV